MKILNLYAGLGGNRKLWEDVEVTAVELDSKIATVYKRFYPKDVVVEGDAHQYLLDHADEKLRVRRLSEIADSIRTFIDFANNSPELEFLITPVGCGLAGFEQSIIKPLFGELPVNCKFSKEWDV